jgi:hypothetical protein
MESKNIDITKSQSQLIEYALEDLLNDDDFEGFSLEAKKDMKILINKFFDLTKSYE